MPNPEKALLPAPFIVGASRSGTTLLRLMLDAHPDLAIPPETHFIPDAARACQESSPSPEAFLAALIGHRCWPDQHVDAGLLRQRVLALQPFEPGAALRAFYHLYAERFGKARWGDKTPPYQLHLRLIASLLPEAHFIHLIRDGRDVALSIKGLWFGPDSIAEAASWWVQRIQETRRQARSLPQYRELRYEDLVQNTEPALRQVCQWIALPWDPAMLRYHERAGERLCEIDRAVQAVDGKRVIAAQDRMAIHAMTQHPPEPSRIGRWRQEMNAADLRRFQKIAGPLLQELGYELA